MRTVYVIEHQRPYGSVARRTSHTSPRCAWRRFHECVKQPKSAVFILVNGKELLPAELEERAAR